MKNRKCVVTVTNSNGEPDLFFVIVQCTDENYDNGLKGLSYLQPILKLYVRLKQMIKLQMKLMYIYYDPIRKGGYIHKQEMLTFFNKI